MCLFLPQSQQWSSPNLWRTRQWRRKLLRHWSVKCPERVLRSAGSERDKRFVKPRSMNWLSVDARGDWWSTTALRTMPRCTHVMPRSSKPPASWRSCVSAQNDCLWLLWWTCPNGDSGVFFSPAPHVEFSKPLHDVEVKEKESAKFECEVSRESAKVKSPPPSIFNLQYLA